MSEADGRRESGCVCMYCLHFDYKWRTNSVEHLNKGHFGADMNSADLNVLYRVVFLFGRLDQNPLYWDCKLHVRIVMPCWP